MSYVTCLCIAPDSIARATRRLLKLSGAASPSYFSASERVVRDRAHAVANGPALRAFLSTRREFTLATMAGTWDISEYSERRFKFTFYGRRTMLDAELASVVRRMAGCCEFAYACEDREERARNRVEVELSDGSSIESYAGVDLRRYLPGLYWITYVSRGQIRKRKIDVDALGAQRVELLRTGVLLHMYEDRRDWRDHFVRIGKTLAQQDAFFSRDRLDRSLSRLRSRTEAGVDRCLDRWP